MSIRIDFSGNLGEKTPKLVIKKLKLVEIVYLLLIPQESKLNDLAEGEVSL